MKSITGLYAMLAAVMAVNVKRYGLSSPAGRPCEKEIKQWRLKGKKRRQK